MGAHLNMETVADLADLYRWRDRNAWRTDHRYVSWQKPANDRHIDRFERESSPAEVAEARRVA